jgi:phosphopantothenoylcysteine decarboxylase/phosphopantothenate--cysteine ligase
MNFLITAGPTREPIDPVRFLSNRSSGKMGYAVAAAAVELGHHAVLVSGPVNLPQPPGTQLASVTTSDEMYDAVHRNLPRAEVAVLTAAVADFKPASYSRSKQKKSNAPMMLPLVPTRDILASLRKAAGPELCIVGFAAETENLIENARAKLLAKDCDMCVANLVGVDGIGIEADDNEVIFLFRDGSAEEIPRASKLEIGKKIVRAVEQIAKKR